MDLTISLEITCDEHKEPRTIYACTVLGGRRRSLDTKLAELREEALQAVADHREASHASGLLPRVQEGQEE